MSAAGSLRKHMARSGGGAVVGRLYPCLGQGVCGKSLI